MNFRPLAATTPFPGSTPSPAPSASTSPKPTGRAAVAPPIQAWSTRHNGADSGVAKRRWSPTSEPASPRLVEHDLIDDETFDILCEEELLAESDRGCFDEYLVRMNDRSAGAAPATGAGPGTAARADARLRSGTTTDRTREADRAGESASAKKRGRPTIDRTGLTLVRFMDDFESALDKHFTLEQLITLPRPVPMKALQDLLRTVGHRIEMTALIGALNARLDNLCFNRMGPARNLPTYLDSRQVALAFDLQGAALPAFRSLEDMQLHLQSGNRPVRTTLDALRKVAATDMRWANLPMYTTPRPAPAQR